jgi:membrane-anchored protein YejM (alkaline phosphatase superfamily)
MFKLFKAAWKKPFSPLDLMIVSIAYSGFIAWLAMDRTITIHDGGFRVFLIRYSWFVGLLLLNNLIWLIFSMIKDYRYRHYKRKKLNIHLFVASHIIMALVLVSDFIHYILFGVHWNAMSISTAYYGILVGSAPLGLQYSQIALFVIALLMLFYATLFVVKLLPKIHIGVSRKTHTQLFVGVSLTVVVLVLVQRSIEPNWHSEQIQKLIPFFQFVSPRPQFPAIDKQLTGITDVKTKQEALFERIEKNSLKISNVMTEQAQPVEHYYDITFVHIEALRHDLLTPKHLPNIYRFVNDDGAEHLPHHYSSSNNTVGSIFGLVSGLSGPLYQFQRDEAIALPSVSYLQQLGYQLSLFTSSSMVYQDALSYVFKGFDNHEFVGRGNVIEDKAMLDDYLAFMQTPSTQPRFNYVIFNSIHFPYVYPESFNQFQPVVEKVGLSYRASDRAHLEGNKIGLKNRFYNSALYIDDLLGQLIDGLKASNYFANGVLVIVGDHGQEFWEHNRFGHSWSLVDEQTKVVAVVKAPEPINSAYRYSSHSDLLPSILYAMGVGEEALAPFTGKILQQFTPENDFVTVGTGVMGTQKPSKAAVIGDGIKVQYYYAPELAVDTVTTATDDKLNNIPRQQTLSLVTRSLAETTQYAWRNTLDSQNSPSDFNSQVEKIQESQHAQSH